MRSLRIGLLLGLRQLQHASRWTTVLIITVMMLTFLNLIAVSGILIGLITGAEQAVQEKTIGDILISARDDEDHIRHTSTIIAALQTHPHIDQFSVRFISGGTIEANYRDRRDLRADRDIANTRVLGINPTDESRVTRLDVDITEGTYLSPDDHTGILIGSILVERYTEGFPDIADSIGDVYPGDKVRITINGSTQEFTVRGIVDSKVGDLTNSVFIHDHALLRLADRPSRNADRIIVNATDPSHDLTIQTNLIALGFDRHAKIQTFDEARPKFIQDIKGTFHLLGIFIGGVGIVVASITIFIIIFINALSRRRQIGILKAIGIDRRAIEIAYVLQATVYVVIGSLLGMIITYGFLVGYFARNPIDFPFSDGILVAEPMGTLLRFAALFGVTLLAGFVPAWLIVRGNTLDAILGRT